MLIDELLTYLFDGQPHLLAPPTSAWLASSRRFTAFVSEFRPKIRKKIRITQDSESALDLQLELETAYLLSQERSFTLVYEPLPIGQVRGPDFSVTFTTSSLFMLEVTRLRVIQDRTKEQTLSPLQERITDMVCDKLGQFLPQHINILLVGLESGSITQENLHAAMLHLQQRAEHNDTAVVQRHGFRDRADFFHHYQRLSELLVCTPQLQGSEQVMSWVNPQAKHQLSGKVRTALYRSLNKL